MTDRASSTASSRLPACGGQLLVTPACLWHGSSHFSAERCPGQQDAPRSPAPDRLRRHGHPLSVIRPESSPNGITFVLIAHRPAPKTGPRGAGSARGIERTVMAGRSGWPDGVNACLLYTSDAA